MKRKTNPTIVLLFGWALVLWAALLAAQGYLQGIQLSELVSNLTYALQHPFNIQWKEHSPIFLLVSSGIYICGIAYWYSTKRNARDTEEYGSARWGNVNALCRKYRQKKNIIFTQNFRLGTDPYKHKRNLHSLIIGGSGASKTRGFCIPNLLEADGSQSFYVCDPKGEMLRSCGSFLEKQGYEIRVFDLIDFGSSYSFNPFEYMESDADVLRMIGNLMDNTTPPNAQENDPFWKKAEQTLLTAMAMLLVHEAPSYEQNFPMVMELIRAAEVKEDNENYVSCLDMLFERVAMRDPEHIAVRQYALFKQSAGKTAKSIITSLAVRLSFYDLNEIANISIKDELDFASMGEKPVALFCVIPDSDKSLNFLVGLMWSTAIQTLFRLADRKYRGPLPVPVHFIFDEWANIPLPKDYEAILSTARSRGCHLHTVVQGISQIKAKYKDSWHNIIGNADSILYLGGSEQESHKLASEMLGKESVDIKTHSQSKGRNGSYSTNFQRVGRELLTPDEVRLLDNDYAIYFLRGERAVMDRKYDVTKHPNAKYSAIAGGPVFDHTKVPLARHDIVLDRERIDDYELSSGFDAALESSNILEGVFDEE